MKAFPLLLSRAGLRDRVRFADGSSRPDRAHVPRMNRELPGLPFPYRSFIAPTPPAGNPLFGIANGPDGNVWATEFDANVILRVTPVGQVTEFPMPTPNVGLAEITTGPDGNLWFSEYNTNSIGRMTVAGTVTEFPLPPWLATIDNAGPRGLVTGPDGNIWFLHPAGYVGKLSRSGRLLAVYPTPLQPMGGVIIAVGPDGNLWFPEADQARIGRITPRGVISEFLLTAPNSVPVGIVAAKDGTMWFTDRGANEVGQITMSGVISVFPLPTPDARAQRITTFPDGSIWFVEGNNGNGQVARILNGGRTIREYPLPAPAYPFAVVAGRNGNLWFTDGVGAVGKLTVGTDR